MLGDAGWSPSSSEGMEAPEQRPSSALLSLSFPAGPGPWLEQLKSCILLEAFRIVTGAKQIFVLVPFLEVSLCITASRY